MARENNDVLFDGILVGVVATLLGATGLYLVAKLTGNVP